MKTATLIPAYGRDYSSKKAVMADYNADKDFILRDIMSFYDGKFINKSQIDNATDYTDINFRYDKLRKIHTIKVR